MDLLEVCESMAANISDHDAFTAGEQHISAQDKQRWQQLFSFTPTDAEKEITNWRLDFSRPTISLAAWDLVRDEKLAMGYNKEAYEYSLPPRYRSQQQQIAHTKKHIDFMATFLLKLQEPLDSVVAVQAWAELEQPPTIMQGQNSESEGEGASFCIVDRATKRKILDAFSHSNSVTNPTFVRICKAAKDLSNDSLQPTLGVDPTLPQFRGTPGRPFLPRQDEYPVWYFFYGTLADSDVLARVLGLTESELSYKTARIHGGKLTTWGGKYQALVDDYDTSSPVDGWAYLVESREQEETLQYYETEKYEVARCKIIFTEGHLGITEEVDGLTFRARKCVI